MIKIAPKEVQQLNRLLTTNWLLATTDNKNVGLVPVNYIKRHEIMAVTNETKPQQPAIVNEGVPIIKSDETASNVVVANDEEKSSVMA